MSNQNPHAGFVALLEEAASVRGARVSSETLAGGDELVNISSSQPGFFGVTFRGDAWSGFLWINLPSSDQIGPFEVTREDFTDVGRIIELALEGGLGVTVRRGLIGFYPHSVEFGSGSWTLPRGATQRLAHKYAKLRMVSGEDR